MPVISTSIQPGTQLLIDRVAKTNTWSVILLGEKQNKKVCVCVYLNNFTDLDYGLI